MAQAQVQDVKPSFFVQRVEGPFKKTKIVYKKETVGGKTVNTKTEVEHIIPHGYMVFHPRQHSVFLTEDRLKELKLDEQPKLVDMNSGDVVGVLGIPLSMAEVKKPDRVTKEK